MTIILFIDILEKLQTIHICIMNKYVKMLKNKLIKMSSSSIYRKVSNKSVEILTKTFRMKIFLEGRVNNQS